MQSNLPEDVARSLTRGMAAFLKAKRAQDLPANLRPIRSFAPKALASHRKTLFAALDDDGVRSRIVEWLDEKQHPLSKADASALRIAAERADGWEKKLDGSLGEKRGTPKPRADKTETLTAALEREKEKGRKARLDAKRARDEAETLVKAEREKRRAGEAELTALRTELKTTTARAVAAERKAEKAETELSRHQRKTRKDEQRSDGVAEKLRRELKDARKELRDAQSQLSRLEQKKKAPSKKTTSVRKAPTGPRRPLPYVKGLLDNDPRTLDRWLETEDVSLLVDGYNVTKSKGGFGDLALPEQRRRLIDSVNALARKKKRKATIVFDGSVVPPAASRRSKGPAMVEYSRPDEIADDHLIALLEGLPPHPVIVVTDDKELRGRASALGATVAGSKQLLALIR